VTVRAARFPTWLRVVLGVQLALALLFWLLAWDHTVSLAQGRVARLVDVIALMLPLASVLVLGAASLLLWRADHRGPAILCGLIPWFVALAAFSLLGAI
jgi:hypothetical protein